ncbi:GNAT family N-acetyltransferase [Nonomuraea sp. NPDC004297]
MEWGPLTLQDARPLARLRAEVAAADRTGEAHSVDDVRDQLSHHLIDLAGGTLAARDGDRLVAFGYLPVRQSADGGVHMMRLGGGVHPAYRGRGHGRRIVDWAIAAAPRLSDRAFPGVPVDLLLVADEDDPGLAALAERTGFTLVRTFAHMERGLAGDLPALAAPPGVSVTTWSPELDDEARRVRNESFRDHWGTVPHTPESWAGSLTGSRNFRPESSFLAMAGGRGVGVLMTHARGAGVAWIQVVGTLKDWRGKGVAGALMAHALAAFARQGYAASGLGVDLGNATGAVAVYTRAGFAVTRRQANHTLRLTQGEARHEPGVPVPE